MLLAISSSAVPSSKRHSTPQVGCTDDTCLRQITVTPKSSQNEVVMLPDCQILVRVTVAPADGAANKAVVKALSEALSLPSSRIRIVKGATSHRKLIRFQISDVELKKILSALPAMPGPSSG